MAPTEDRIAADPQTSLDVVVVPTGIEPANRGPGGSRQMPDSPFLYGLSRF